MNNGESNFYFNNTTLKSQTFSKEPQVSFSKSINLLLMQICLRAPKMKGKKMNVLTLTLFAAAAAVSTICDHVN